MNTATSKPRNVIRLSLLAGAAAAALSATALSAAPAASAAAPATVKVSGGALVYEAAAGQNNHLYIFKSGSQVHVRDVVEISPGAGCVRVTVKEARCGTGVTGLSAVLGDGDDVAKIDVGLQGTLNGGAGDDIYLGGAAPTQSRITFQGGSGTDTASYAFAASSVRVNLDLPGSDGRNGSVIDFDDIRPDVENIIGSNFADDLTGGNFSNNRIEGMGGADSMRGLGGNDTLIAKDGAADQLIDCGAGTGDSVSFDGNDPARIGCERILA